MTLGIRAYVSQLGPDGLGHDRCAPACLASYLLDQGWESDPWLLLQELAAATNPLEADEAHGAGELIRAAQSKGFRGQIWAQWPLAAGALLLPAAGVFALVDNRLLRPTAYPNSPAWHALHWIRLVALLGDDAGLCLVFDPLTYLPQPVGEPYQGPVLYTTDSVRSAIQATPEAYAGVIVQLPLAAPTDDAEPAP